MQIKIIEDHTDEIIRRVNENTHIALEACGVQGEGNAIKEVTSAVYDTPESPTYRRTGALRNSITHDSDDDFAYIGSNIEYAPYVEMGTSKMSPRPFIRPALENHTDEYAAILERFLKIN